MGATSPVLIAAQTLALVWTVGAALGPAPKLVPAVAASIAWLVWQWARKRWPRPVARGTWLAVAGLALLVWLDPPWASALTTLIRTGARQWQSAGDAVLTDSSLGYGVTALPLLALASLYYGQFRDTRGNSRETLRATGNGLVVLLLAGLYNWPPVLWGTFIYVPLAFGLVAITRAQELATTRHRGNVQQQLLAWGTATALAVFLAVTVLPDWSAPLDGLSWRPRSKPPVLTARLPFPHEVDGMGDDVEQLDEFMAVTEGGTGEERPRDPLLGLYLVLLFVAVAVPTALMYRWARRRAVDSDTDAAPRPSGDGWPEFPQGPWPNVIVHAFLWLIARLWPRPPRPGLTATEHVALLSAQRPALAAPLQRMLGQFLPVRYGRSEHVNGDAQPPRAYDDLRQDWDEVRQAIEEEALLQAHPGWQGRLLVAWRRLRQRRLRQRPRQQSRQ